jgi:hypothetical protein
LESPEKENRDVEEENYQDEEGEGEELKESEHLPNMNLVWVETELEEDYVGIDSNLWSKEDHSTSNSTTIASTPVETSIEEFLEKDEQNEKD